MKGKLIFGLLLVSIAILISILIWKYGTNRPVKVAFVKAEVLFNEFELTKELKVNYSNTENARAAILDSLELLMKFEEPKQSMKYKQMVKVYELQRQRFESDNEVLSEKFDAQVWERINQYVSEYATSNHYDIVLGANGSGSLMYASDQYDITKEVVEFMNKKYNGKGK